MRAGGRENSRSLRDAVYQHSSAARANAETHRVSPCDGAREQYPITMVRCGSFRTPPL
jgi:hypothetical protein